MNKNITTFFQSLHKEQWQEVRLREVAEINPSESIKKNTIAKKVSMDNLEPFNKKIYSFNMESFKGGSKFRNGDTLLARITPCLENGKTAFVDFLENNEIAFGSTEFIILRQKENISDKHFLYYLARNENFRETAIKSMTGSSGRERVQIEVIRDYEFLLPPLKIQQQIAEILSSFDDKIDLLHRQNKTLESLALTLFRHIFIDNPKNPNAPCHSEGEARRNSTDKESIGMKSHRDISLTLNMTSGGICHSELEHSESEESNQNRDSSVFAKLQNDTKSVVEVGESLRGGGSDFALVSQETSPDLHIQAPPRSHKKDEKWQVGRLGDEFDFTMGVSPEGNSYNEDSQGIPMFQGNADFGFRFPNNRIYTTKPKRLAQPFDTLISVRAPVGELNMAKETCCIGRGLAAFRYKQDSNLYSYAYYKLHSLLKEIKQFNDTGTVFGAISKGDFENIVITIPPLDFIKNLNQQLKNFDDKIYNNTKQIQNLQSMRDMLLAKILNDKMEG